MKKLLVLMLLLRSLTLLPADATFSDDLLQRAKAGDAEAQFTLGYVYSNGAGVAKDRAGRSSGIVKLQTRIFWVHIGIWAGCIVQKAQNRTLPKQKNGLERQRRRVTGIRR